MTSTSEKLRAITLTALMVLSVFGGTVAFSGAAAADIGANKGATIDNFGGSAQQTTNLSAAIRANSTYSGGNTFQKAKVDLNFGGFDGDFSSVTASDVRVRSYDSKQKFDNGNFNFSLTPTSISTSNNGETLTVDTGDKQNVAQGQIIEIRIVNGQFQNPSEGGTYTGEVDINTTRTGDEATDDYFVSGQDTTDDDTGLQFDANWTTGQDRYQGQTLNFRNDTTFGGDAFTSPLQDPRIITCDDFDSDLYDCGGSRVRSLDVTAGGEVNISTGDLQGQYAIAATDGDGNTFYAITDTDGNVTAWQQRRTGETDPIPYVNVIVQNLNTTFDRDSVSQGSSANLNVDSQRGDYNVTVTSSDLSASRIQTLYSASDNSDVETTTNGVKLLVDSSRDDFDVSPTSSFPTGDYTFDFEVEDTGVTDSDSISVVSGQDVDAQFSKSVYTEQEGDNATITVDLNKVDSAVIIMGGKDVNYQTNVRVDDNDDDGQVVLNVNTYLAAQSPQQAFTAGEGDAIGFIDNKIEAEEPPLDPAEYELTARANNEDKDAALLNLGQRSTNDGKVYVAPSAFEETDPGDYGDANDVRDAISAGSTVAQGDQVVVQYNATGLYGYVNGIEDFENNNSETFSEGDGTEVLLFLNDTSGAAVNQEQQAVGDVTAEGKVFTDADNDTFFVVVDTDSFDGLETGQYELTFTVPEGNDYIAEGEAENVSKTFTVKERSLEFDTDDQGIVTVEPEADQTISGTTNLAPDTEFNIRARSSTFLKTDSVTVQDDGTFSTAFDFSNVSENTSFTVTARVDGIDTETPGRVGQAETAGATLNNQTFTGQAETVNVAQVTTSDGGFVTIHDSTLVSDGAVFDSVRGTSDYLEPGQVQNVSITLDDPVGTNESGDTFYAMPHLDTDGDQTYDFVTSEGADDGPYTTSEGNAVVDPAVFTVNEVATVTFNDQETDGTFAVVASADLPSGGFVTIHDDTVADDPFGSVRGTSDYLEPGESTDINITLDTPAEETGQFFAMPHRDTDGDQTYDFVTSNGQDDGPYLNAEGQIVLDGGQLSVPQPATASVTFEDQTLEDGSVTVASASLSEGGFVTIHDDTVADDPLGSVVGTSDYLEAGSSSDISIDVDISESGQYFAMPHLDTNGNQEYDFVSSEGSADGPYTTSAGDIVLDSAQITVEEPTPTPTEEPTESPTEEPEPTDTPTTTSDGQPGFGLALSLIALVGAALIALRRRD